MTVINTFHIPVKSLNAEKIVGSLNTKSKNNSDASLNLNFDLPFHKPHRLTGRICQITIKRSWDALSKRDKSTYTFAFTINLICSKT